MAESKITKNGRIKLCKAHAGDITLPIITQMAFGDGGVDADGNPVEVTGEETKLHNELLRKNIDGHTYLEDGVRCKYSAHLTKPELPNKYISEIGLIDNEGTLIALETCLKKGKDENREFIIEIDEIF